MIMSANHCGVCLPVLLSACLWLLFAFSCSRDPEVPHVVHAVNDSHRAPQIPRIIPSNVSVNSQNLLGFSWEYILPHSLTAILPLSSHHEIPLWALLEPLLHPSTAIGEIIILCPQSTIGDVRRDLQTAFETFVPLDHLDVSLRQWHPSIDMTTALLQAATTVVTPWVLILDQSGLYRTSESAYMALVRPPNTTVPLGVEGNPLDNASILPTHFGQVQPALFLRPPFVVKSSLALEFGPTIQTTATWAQFGSFVAGERFDSIGGLILSDNRSMETYSEHEQTNLLDPALQHQLQALAELDRDPLLTPPWAPKQVDFLIVLPATDDIERVSRLVCGLTANGSYHVRILVLEAHVAEFLPGRFTKETCIIEYELLPEVRDQSACHSCDALLAWQLESGHTTPGVVLSVPDDDPTLAAFISRFFGNATIILIPRIDLKHTDWMVSLTLAEWKNWHRPKLELSIATKDRPQSLLRLLRSLSEARFFGDTINLRINIEQDCDKETLEIAERLKWQHGSVYIHHRVIHGGLLPAVVEAWYPKSNNHYGLLLEDDVEVSPLFYAWVKMTLLRYRYGLERDNNPRMFGVSLYQQKHLELPLEGRRPFDPRELFQKANVTFPATPYLSQVPCSWGAVYFPEHWREFHDYLSLRLTENIAMIEDDIVPNIRSNHWARSWKRFFIELIYLRGYTMLYPNFKDYVSLSTNHLEVGSHVKVRSQEKKDLFLLPLMPLPGNGEASGLLELPANSLPPMDQLPIMNLTGHLTTFKDLEGQGLARREELFGSSGCDHPANSNLYDINSLTCQ